MSRPRCLADFPQPAFGRDTGELFRECLLRRLGNSFVPRCLREEACPEDCELAVRLASCDEGPPTRAEAAWRGSR